MKAAPSTFFLCIVLAAVLFWLFSHATSFHL